MILVLLAMIQLGFLIVIHEGGHFLVARMSGMRVDRFSVGFGPALFKFQRGETLYQLSLIPLGGYVQIAGLNPGDESMEADDPRSYLNRPVYQRLLTIFAGPGTNYLFAALLMAVIYAAWGVPVPGRMPVVGELVEGRPAAAAGLQIEDEIVAINGRSVRDMGDVSAIIDGAKGAPVKIEVRRENQPREFTIHPVQDSDGRWRIGIALAPSELRERQPIGTALVAGFVWPYEQTVFILHSFADIFRGKQKAEFSGPVGIVKVMKRRIAMGPLKAFEIMAIISVYLGLFNLLPIPALDGGRLAFLVVEGISRRRVNQNLEQLVHLGGMLVLFAFLLYVTFGHDVPIKNLFRH